MAGGSEVRIQLFTTAYRKINEIVLRDLPAGISTVKLQLRDVKGKRLANGVYYVRVLAGRSEAIGKLVILR